PFRTQAADPPSARPARGAEQPPSGTPRVGMAPCTSPSTSAPRRGHGGGHAGPKEGLGERCPPAPEPNPLYVKTQLCRFFAAGACLRSTGCKFAHGPTELKTLPDFTRIGAGRVESKNKHLHKHSADFSDRRWGALAAKSAQTVTS
ncbi:unnamed protein product, partial [Prorocentrum cordatum]